jgi:hypothetical protein
MAKDKSIIEKFTDTVKDIANSASKALKAEEPARVDATSAAYMPFAAEGLVSDPLLVPPIAAQPRRPKRTARKSSTRKAAAKRAVSRKPSQKAKTAARNTTKARSRSAAKASAKRTSSSAASKRGAKRAAGKRGRR